MPKQTACICMESTLLQYSNVSLLDREGRREVRNTGSIVFAITICKLRSLQSGQRWCELVVCNVHQNKLTLPKQTCSRLLLFEYA